MVDKLVSLMKEITELQRCPNQDMEVVIENKDQKQRQKPIISVYFKYERAT